jgi:hypothetical protein
VRIAAESSYHRELFLCRNLRPDIDLVTTSLSVKAPTWWATAPRAARALLLTLTLLGAVLRAVGIAQTSHTSVLNMPLADDAFYYFVLARNASAGQWPVISGDGAATSGFQPLWGLMVAGLDVAAGGLSLDGRIVAAQVAGALISLAAAILVLDLMRRLGAGWFASLLAFGAFVLSPQVLKHSLNGMETSLALLAVVALIRLGAMVDPARASSRSAFLAGVVGGLGILARLDLVLLLAAAAAITLVWRRPRPEGEAKRVAANALPGNCRRSPAPHGVDGRGDHGRRPADPRGGLGRAQPGAAVARLAACLAARFAASTGSLRPCIR